jgi:hypothetical protein
VARLRDGWLIGFDAGEYGGSLWWYQSAEGPGVKLSSRNVAFIIPTPDVTQAFVFVGLAHRITDEGEVLRFRMAHDQPVLTSVVDLGSEPRAVLARADGSVLVLTDKLLRRLSAVGEASELCARITQACTRNRSRFRRAVSITSG